jgi:hypothetical protein
MDGFLLVRFEHNPTGLIGGHIMLYTCFQYDHFTYLLFTSAENDVIQHPNTFHTDVKNFAIH